MLTRSLACLAVLAAAACTPQVPDSGATLREQPAQTGQFDMGAPAPVQPFGGPSAVSSSELASAGIGMGQIGTGAPVPPVATAAPAPAPTAANPLGISDENDFNAVSARESIESDAQRRNQLAAQRQEVAPTAIPQRPADTGPNIVQYALTAPNQKGQEWYSRSIFASEARFQRNCARYASPDAAQRDFLANGGPDRNYAGLDPDGDGFACGWDPAPFRLAAGG
ncbi:hypothetical protein [Salipiger sp. IMCC34102]|uniref:hypothetical protein n=1 Tax=Salipiger sp. IMCC34102 TaxID=2510647 RepID=UPI001F5DFC22|nr:hypothetical protein [Salipiger sp. IMCC34102]